MRILRFRAYDKYLNEIFDVLEIDFDEQKVCVNYLGRFRNWVDMRDVELLQFTGTYVAGVPIFEEDLLTHNENRYRVQYDSTLSGYRAVNTICSSDAYALNHIASEVDCSVDGNFFTSMNGLRR